MCLSGEQPGGSVTTPHWFPPVFLKLTLGLCQFSSTCVCICTECVSHVWSHSLSSLIIPGLCRGLSLGLPLATVKFPLRTARTMQTLPSLSTTSASPLAAIFKPQPQVYLCLRHPIISLRCCRKRSYVPEPGKLCDSWVFSLTRISFSSDKNSEKVCNGDNKSGRLGIFRIRLTCLNNTLPGAFWDTL